MNIPLPGYAARALKKSSTMLRLLILLVLCGTGAADTLLPGAQVPPGYKVRRDEAGRVATVLYYNAPGDVGQLPSIVAYCYNPDRPPAHVVAGRETGAAPALTKRQSPAPVTIGKNDYPAVRTRYDSGREDLDVYFKVPGERWVLLHFSHVSSARGASLMTSFLAGLQSLPPEVWQLTPR